MNESVTGSANFFGPMTIETATSPEDLAAIALVVERLHGLRVAVRELEHDLAADPDTRFFLARREGEVVGSGVGKRSSLQGTRSTRSRACSPRLAVEEPARRSTRLSPLMRSRSGSNTSGVASSTLRASGSLSAVALRSSGARSSPF